MSLISKIFTAFVVMMALAMVAGVVGWRSVSSINVTMNDIVEYELVAENDMSALETAFQTVSVAQRTLLNVNLPMETRVDQLQDIAREHAAQKQIVTKLTALLNEGAARVHGWDTVLAEWKNIQPVLEAWDNNVDEAVRKLKVWEDTTILNPDALLRDIMQYRGDHYALATWLGQMIAEDRAIGAEIGSADNTCGFGKWRELSTAVRKRSAATALFAMQWIS